MAASPVGYVKGAKLRGSLYQPPGDDTSGLVSGADTDFFVDHQEPLDALAWLREEGDGWPLGDLPEGHEFLLLFKAGPQRPTAPIGTWVPKE